MRQILACDLGGTSLRAALVDDRGRVAHLASVPCAIPPDRNGASEVDPEDWWAALAQAVDAVARAAGPDFAAAQAVAISAITRTQVFLGADGRVLRPALTLRDTRAGALLPRLQAALPPAHPETAGISAFHPLARLCWLAEAEPVHAAALRAVVEPKDYLNFRLTGRIAIDTVSAARLIAAAAPGPDGRSLFGAAGLSPAVVPGALQPTDIVAPICPGLPGALGLLAGRPLMAMANDTWASVLGLGALRPGLAYNLSGTTEVLGVLSSRAAAAEGLLTVDWGQGLTQIGGPSQNGADTLVWLMGLLARDDDLAAVGPALDALLDAPRDSQPALFLPYLQGERTPYWDPALRGAFLGLNRRHGPADLAHAVLEGVAFLNRIVLGRAEEAAGAPVREIRFGGGGAANARWCQIKADVTRRPVVLVRESEPGLVGAAIVAFAALGYVADIAEGQDKLVAAAARFDPRPGPAAAYDALFPLYRQAEQALAPISRALSATASPA
ncbi:MAG: FGGY-family carbohydrate kinase [Proteobacteria bacterium]|nr:FGGY-family carbohydrate kinase [Pseudomonadota bacterium]